MFWKWLSRRIFIGFKSRLIKRGKLITKLEISKKAKMKRKLNKNQKRITPWDIQFSPQIFLKWLNKMVLERQRRDYRGNCLAQGRTLKSTDSVTRMIIINVTKSGNFNRNFLSNITWCIFIIYSNNVNYVIYFNDFYTNCINKLHDNVIN